MAEASILNSIPYLLMAPSKKIWVDYDEEADVLYISFRKPQNANDSILEDNIHQERWIIFSEIDTAMPCPYRVS